MAGPLDGIRVLEFTQVIAAPFAGQILADLGADVLKIEPPGGESWRLQAAFTPTESKTFQCLNRGKHCMTLRLDSPEARAIVYRLVREMDVVLINYRPDAPVKFGIDYESLRAFNPDLVYVDLTAFGRRGKWAARPGYDGVIQAMSGLMAAEAKTRPEEGSPVTIASTAIVDYSAGYALADAVISGLYHRQMTGAGQMIECSLLISALNLQSQVVMEHPLADADTRNPARDQRRRRAAEGAPYVELLGLRQADQPDNIYHRAYLTRDGGLVIAAETLAEISRVFTFFDVDRDKIDAATVTRLEQQIELGATTAWLDALNGASIPAAPIQFSEEMTGHPQVTASQWMLHLEHSLTGTQTQVSLPLYFSKTPVGMPVASPPLGRDTESVLRHLGYTDEAIVGLCEAGVIRHAAERAGKPVAFRSTQHASATSQQSSHLEPHKSAGRHPGNGVYAGLTVLELAGDIAGALAGRACADRGAEVIKLEPPQGDPLRHSDAYIPGESKLFQTLNRGKKSVVVDPAASSRAVTRLVEAADIVIVSAIDRPNAFELRYEYARQINPAIIYVAASAFGNHGPWAGKYANDLMIQAFAGTLMNERKTRTDGVTPQAIKSTRFGDIGTGLMLCIGLSAALFHRARTGEGQLVETSLLHNLLLLQGQRISDNEAADAATRPAAQALLSARREATSLRQIQRPVPRVVNAFYRAYQTRDGAIFLGALTRGLRDKARAALETDLLTRDAPGWDVRDPIQYETAMEKLRDIEQRVTQRTTAAWLKILEAAGVPNGAVVFPEDLAEISHFRDNDYLIEVEHDTAGKTLQAAPCIRYGRFPKPQFKGAPTLGRDTAEVMRRYT